MSAQFGTQASIQSGNVEQVDEHMGLGRIDKFRIH